MVLASCAVPGSAGPAGPPPRTSPASAASAASAAQPGPGRPTIGFAGPPTSGGARIEPFGPGVGRLRTVAGGVVLLDTPDHDQAKGPVAGSASRRWSPAGPLPGTEAGSRHVDVFYTPHPDDETLSMGALVAAAVQRGDRVVLVALTDGRTTGAVRDVDQQLAGGAPAARAAGNGLSPDQVAAARVGELRRAARDLGLAPGDVFLAHLDAPDSDGGTVVTVSEADQVMRAFAVQFPAATHVTMSYCAERQQDHLDAGFALRDLLRAGVVTSARWVTSRLWWSLPAPASSWTLPDPQAAARVRRAATEYRLWDPAHGEYALGYFSVRWQFAALDRDPRDRVHDDGPVVPGFGAGGSRAGAPGLGLTSGTSGTSGMRPIG